MKNHASQIIPARPGARPPSLMSLNHKSQTQKWPLIGAATATHLSWAPAAACPAAACKLAMWPWSPLKMRRKRSGLTKRTATNCVGAPLSETGSGSQFREEVSAVSADRQESGIVPRLRRLSRARYPSIHPSVTSPISCDKTKLQLRKPCLESSWSLASKSTCVA